MVVKCGSTITRLGVFAGREEAAVELVRSMGAKLDEVARRVTFVFLARPGHRVRARMPKQRIVEMPLLEISSTEIRTRLRRGLSVRYLVPEAVRLRLERWRLYR